jgi:hypothetical protein
MKLILIKILKICNKYHLLDNKLIKIKLIMILDLNLILQLKV